MIRFLLLQGCLFLTGMALANTIIVKNIEELKTANKQAKPGDIIIMLNGEWNNVTISLNCTGTKEQPVTFKAQSPGKVFITGHSQLKIGGSFIIVDGLYFINGYAGDDAVIDFRVNKNQLANNCRVTNCVINDFNNPKRMEENYWVSFYGKNNRLDHCSFLNKKNVGVLLAVILDDERSRENFHSIDHNYFGRRPPLASNGGEIIRVGVSQHCQFNSNTQIHNNFFEHCDGETEIVSIKSCSNSVKENIFKECQGSVVLRHGDNNLVASNFFLGNDKPGSGGVRIINKGQKVVSNIFYKCRGIDFRSPMAIMNGIPNSPANRYVQVTEAEIIDNTFYECSPVTFCEGSDPERTLPPDKVIFSDNSFYNTRDSVIYKIYDDIKGFRFSNNKVSKGLKQSLINGFDKTNIPKQKPITKSTGSAPEHPHVDIIPLTEKETYLSSGAAWFSKKNTSTSVKLLSVNCATAEDVYNQLGRPDPLIIRLTGKEYSLNKPFVITKAVQFTGTNKTTILFNTTNGLSAFIITGNGNLSLMDLTIDGAGVKSRNFISSDTAGSSHHYNLSVRNCTIKNLARENGCNNFFYSYRSMVADSIVIYHNSFLNMHSNGLIMTEEKDNKGYYNAEKIMIGENLFSSVNAVLLDVYRGGNDESTMGPLLVFSNNKINDCSNVASATPLIHLYGVQRSFIEKNKFSECNQGSILIHFEDVVRATHLVRGNVLKRSGYISTDKFVRLENNTIQ